MAAPLYVASVKASIFVPNLFMPFPLYFSPTVSFALGRTRSYKTLRCSRRKEEVRRTDAISEASRERDAGLASLSFPRTLSRSHWNNVGCAPYCNDHILLDLTMESSTIKAQKGSIDPSKNQNIHQCRVPQHTRRNMRSTQWLCIVLSYLSTKTV